MNRRMKMVIAATTAALTAGAAGCSGGEGGSGHGEGTLVMGDSFSLTHPIGSNGTEQFIEGLETRGGDVGLDLQYFASGQLGKQWDMPTVVRTGVADISVISPSYVASEMPLSSVGDLAGLVEDACVASYALKDLMFEGGILYEEEFKPLNIRPLWIGVIPAYEAMTSERPVAVPGDLEGTVQRSTGGAQDRIVDAVGAAGVAMPIGDLYEALTRGTVEGTVASPVSITPYGLHEVIGHSTKGANLGSFTVVYSINEDTWQFLEEDQRALITELAEKSQQSLCEGLNQSVEDSYREMEKENVSFTDVSEDPEAWDALLEPTRQNWVDDLEKMGKPAGQVLEEFEAALEKHAHRAERTTP